MSHPFPHSLGLKLPLDWRARADSGRPAGAEDLYGLLAGCGYRFLEFATGPCLGDGEPDLVRGEARACAAAGLAAAMHPYLGGPYNPAHFGRRPEPAEALQAILTAASTLADLTDAPVTVVLHPAEIQYEPAGAAPAALRDELLRRSRLYFAESTAASPPPIPASASSSSTRCRPAGTNRPSAPATPAPNCCRSWPAPGCPSAGTPATTS